MVVSLALVFNVKGLLLLIGAIIFGILAVYGLLPARAASDWPRGAASAAWCLGFVAWFIWASGG